jgi:hypothetical protein
MTALLVMLVGLLVGAPPALAGGWAVTLLDPLPDRIEPGRAYTVGFWVLQHGSHPFEGELTPVGLKLVDATGATTISPGTALPEAAHYATSIIVPAPGTYSLFGLQGMFQEYKIGTLTVPGGLSTLAMPPPVPVPASAQPWTAIRPPTVPIDQTRGPFDQEAAQPRQAASVAQPTAVAARPVSGGLRPAMSVLGIVVVTAAGLGLLLIRRRRRAAAATPQRSAQRPIELGVR